MMSSAKPCSATDKKEAVVMLYCSGGLLVSLSTSVSRHFQQLVSIHKEEEKHAEMIHCVETFFCNVTKRSVDQVESSDLPSNSFPPRASLPETNFLSPETSKC